MTRSSALLARTNEGAWGTMLILVVQLLSDPASLLVTQQKLLIQGLQEENVALKREINIIHEMKVSEAQRREDFVVLKSELQKEKDERERLQVELSQEQEEKNKLQGALDKDVTVNSSRGPISKTLVYVFCVATTQKTQETCRKPRKHDYLATFGIFPETCPVT